MSSAMSFARRVHVVALAIPCLLPLLSGCDLEPESYPAELTYPLRSDPIVASPPGSTTWDTHGPGQLDNHIAHLSEVGGKTLDPAKLAAKDRQQLQDTLRDIFGTPAAPTVKIKDEDQDNINKLIADLRLDEKTLAKGSTVYRRHCMHCHGVTGDGRGPTGPWVNPTPRDYRQGLFKFISAGVRVSDRKPRRADIRRTLERGIEGTSMPSFHTLEDEEKESLVSYVIHLSLRGEVERYTMEPLLDGTGLDGSVAEKVKDLLTDSRSGLLRAWGRSNTEGIEPSNYPYREDNTEQFQASINRGYKLFTDPRGSASCINCHLDFGRQAPFRYDKWGTLVRPSNLTAGVYRGGRRPIDLYWRIRGGIDPSQMPCADFEDKTANRDQWRDNADPYWDLVNFVQALPYPKMLPKDIRDEIYGTRREKTTEHARR